MKATWFKADGDEVCGSCKRHLTEGEEACFHGVLRCEPCMAHLEDLAIGEFDASDPRYAEGGRP